MKLILSLLLPFAFLGLLHSSRDLIESIFPDYSRTEVSLLTASVGVILILVLVNLLGEFRKKP